MKSAKNKIDARKEKVAKVWTTTKKKELKTCAYLCVCQRISVSVSMAAHCLLFIFFVSRWCALFPSPTTRAFFFTVRWSSSSSSAQQTVLIFARLPFHLVSELLNSNNNSNNYNCNNKPSAQTKTSNFQLSIDRIVNRHGCRSSYLENTLWWMHANEKAHRWDTSREISMQQEVENKERKK